MALTRRLKSDWPAGAADDVGVAPESSTVAKHYNILNVCIYAQYQELMSAAQRS